MPAEDRARKPGAPPPVPEETPARTAGEASGDPSRERAVSMRELLASCAAADAVSTPPSDAGGTAGGPDRADAEDTVEATDPVDTPDADGSTEERTPQAAHARPGRHPGRNAA